MIEAETSASLKDDNPQPGQKNTNTNFPQEISVSVTKDDGSLIVIPIQIKLLDVEALPTEYLDVKIEVDYGNENAVAPSVQETNTIDHKGELQLPAHRCHTCSKAFATRQHLERHSNLHSKGTLYPCNICGKVMFDKSYLLRHMQIHSSTRPYECHICQKTFSTANSLKRHITLHDQTLRSHICSTCGKGFPDNSSLRKHCHLHSGVKTYSCSICCKGFPHVGDLNLHMKRHYSDKPFVCDKCGKEFSRQNNLIRHKKIHIGEGEYKCVSCKVCYRHAGTLTRHILECHPDKATRKETVRRASLQEKINMSVKDGSASHANM